MNVAQVIELLAAVDPGAAVYMAAGTSPMRVGQVLDADNGSGVTLFPLSDFYWVLKATDCDQYLALKTRGHEQCSKTRRGAIRYTTALDAFRSVRSCIMPENYRVVRVRKRASPLPGEGGVT